MICYYDIIYFNLLHAFHKTQKNFVEHFIFIKKFNSYNAEQYVDNESSQSSLNLKVVQTLHHFFLFFGQRRVTSAIISSVFIFQKKNLFIA